MYFLISSRKESYFGATHSSFQDLSVNSEYLKGLGNFHDQSFESYFNTQAKIRFRLLKQFSTSVTWIGLPLFFLFYSHSAWVFAGEHAMDHVRFYKGEYSFISRFYTSQRNSSKDLELFRWSSCRRSDQLRSQLIVGIKSWTNLKTLGTSSSNQKKTQRK